MTGKYAFAKIPKYPHLRPEDILIWEKFIDNFPGFYESVDYDVHVGQGRDYPEVEEPKIYDDMKWLSLKRIDVVGYRKDRVDIIEVKPRAGASAVGQVEVYTDLYKEKFPDVKNLKKIIITDDMDPDTTRICGYRDIGVLITKEKYLEEE